MISDTKYSEQNTSYPSNPQIAVKILILLLYIWYENLTFYTNNTRQIGWKVQQNSTLLTFFMLLIKGI